MEDSMRAMRKHIFPVRLSATELQLLRGLAESEGRTMGNTVRRAIVVLSKNVEEGGGGDVPKMAQPQPGEQAAAT